jgi:FKBP-type peptidyl-prolyl cis-trans isomerase
MQFSRQLLCVAAAGLALTACNQVEYKKTAGGMPYQVFSSNKGDSVKPGSIIKISYKQMINDSTVFPPAGQPATPIYFQVSGESQPYDISEVLTLLKEGDSAYAVQLVDTFMARQARNPQAQPLPAELKKGDKLITSLKVQRVFSSPDEAQADEAKERELAFKSNKTIQDQLAIDDKSLQAYLSKNSIQAKKVGLGTYVQVLQPGSGPQITEGKGVSLMYKGQTQEGVVFDTNMDNSFKHTDPLTFVVGASPMIKGFAEGVIGLSKGAKARLFIPSALAYGANPPSPDIKPNENLIFDIEVLDVNDGAPTANAPGSPTNGGSQR